ncbi:hypothetical protein F5Y17DRAFT_262027 [Xylariaceae sp. FL0594]|nr:hypothetical protein F5Y17DRAFT_262027 [Xylariaceae sp. FL0594]
MDDHESHGQASPDPSDSSDDGYSRDGVMPWCPSPPRPDLPGKDAPGPDPADLSEGDSSNKVPDKASNKRSRDALDDASDQPSKKPARGSLQDISSSIGSKIEEIKPKSEGYQEGTKKIISHIIEVVYRVLARLDSDPNYQCLPHDVFIHLFRSRSPKLLATDEKLWKIMVGVVPASIDKAARFDLHTTLKFYDAIDSEYKEKFGTDLEVRLVWKTHKANEVEMGYEAANPVWKPGAMANEEDKIRHMAATLRDLAKDFPEWDLNEKKRPEPVNVKIPTIDLGLFKTPRPGKGVAESEPQPQLLPELRSLTLGP